jgi:superfamily II DNA/RNA helicase
MDPPPPKAGNKRKKRRRPKKSKPENPPSPPSPPSYPKKNLGDPNQKKEDTPLYKDDADVKVVGVKGALRCENWNEMNFDQQLLKNIKMCDFTWPRKVQEVVLPYVVDGFDIQCQSETGTGKTASYLIPLIDMLIKEKQKLGKLRDDGPYCIIIAPSHEFVKQIYQEATKLAYKTGITVAVGYGGISIKKTLKRMSEGCNILCVCLGRMFNLMKHDIEGYDYVHMLNLKYLVIDEIDHFLEGNQKTDIVKFFQHEYLPPAQKRQTLFFSPTLQAGLLDKAAKEENERIKKEEDKRIKKEKEKNHQQPPATVVANLPKAKKEKEKLVVFDNVKKRIFIASVSESNQRIKYIIDYLPDENAKFLHLTKRISNISESFGGQYPRILIFVNTKDFANELQKDLTIAGFPADVIHSDFRQQERDKAYGNFKNGLSGSRILVSIKICGRGVDIPDMDYVINYDLPDVRKYFSPKQTFIQRCGRTGRVESGTAITFYVESEDRISAVWLREVLQNANHKVPDFLKDTSGIETFMGELSINGNNK